MKKYILVLIWALFINQAECQNWQWAISCGKSNGDDIGKLAIDNNSNIYLAGIFYQPYGYFGNDTFLTNGGTDIVFSKMNSTGNFQWVHQIYGNGTENVPGISFNASTNSVFLGGSFDDSITIGSTSLVSSGASDIFFTKYDINGNAIWAKKAGGNHLDLAVNITSDNNGNLYAIGYVNDTAYFDNYVVPKGAFLAKYNNNGTCQWAKKIISDANINGISCYNNKIVIAGNTVNDTITIDSDTLFSSNNFGADLVVAAFDLNGNLIWAKLDASGTVAYVPEAKYDNLGNIYVTGLVAGFDTVKFGNVIFPPGGIEIFLVKYDINGAVIWAQESASSYECSIFDLSINNGDGSCYLTGRFQDTFSLGSFTVSGSSFNEEHMFIARFDANGDCLGIRNTQVDVDGPNPGRGYSVVQDANSTCYVAGQFSNTSNFGNFSLTSVWQKDIFIAKTDAITGIGGEGKPAGHELVIYANPNAGKCNIKVPEDLINEKKLTLQIFDNNGKLLQQKVLEMNEGKIILNLDTEAKGIYHVTLSSRKKTYNGKIIFE